MPIVFPHAGGYAVSDQTFVAAWKLYVGHHFPGANWQNFCMPLNHRRASYCHLNPGLDQLCRTLVPYRNTMQASRKFMTANGHLLTGCKAGGRGGRTVKGAHLSNALLQTWNALAPSAQSSIEIATEAILEADAEEDVEPEERPAPKSAEGNQTSPHPSKVTASTPILAAARRTALVAALVDEIHVQPFQAHYRRRPHGGPVLGWANRLHAYFWPRPDPAFGPIPTSAGLQAIYGALQPLIVSVHAGSAWSAAQNAQAVAQTGRLFAWGGVRSRKWTAKDVRSVMDSSIHGAARGAPMNSGWTKLAALCSQSTPHNEQAIWDSRVSASVVTRLDALMVLPGDTPAALFPDLGPVRAFRTAGPRRQLTNSLRHTWPNGYKSWRAHFAGGQLVREMVDVLNANPLKYGQMPARIAGAAPGAWDVRGVEMVLFMDGY